MSNISYLKGAVFEHQFWLQILGDHGRFIYDSLSPDEIEKVGMADNFIKIFDELLEQSRKELNEEQIYELTTMSFGYTDEFRKFKLELISDHLTNKIKIGLPPTFINQMVNEIEEYLRILQSLLERKIPDVYPLHLHNLWLPDAAGHASGIQCRLDDVEADLITKSRDFEKEFHDLHRKAEEFSGYTRTNMVEFPALKRLNNQVEIKIGMFMRFLKDLEDLRVSKRVVGALLPLMTDHMYREECYYIFTLSRVSQVKDPDCDPTTPRISD
ncbi:MAG: DUF2935 domain-containing protein [Bacillota bacterium]